MMPNKSAYVRSELSQSPFGVIIFRSLLLGMVVLSAAAQTRLDSAQVAPLTGDVRGLFSSTILRDYDSVMDHGNGMSNAIAAAIQDCGTVQTCMIMVPSNYGVAEAIPGYQLNYAIPSTAATTSGNISIFDRRYSEARMSVNNLGYNAGLINSPAGWVYNYYAKASQNAFLASLYLRQWSLDGGNNQQNSALSYADKTTWATVLSTEVSHTPAQKISIALGTETTSLGDVLGINNSVTCYGGVNAQADLGCHAFDNNILQGTVEYSGTITGSPAIGSNTLSVSVTQGQYTQGSGRYLVKTNAETINSGTISNIASAFGSVPVVTGMGTSWPVSSVIGHLGTDVTAPGVAVVSPSGFTVGAMAGLNTSSLVCVADQESFEMLYPTLITASTMTANFAKIHLSNAIIATGGVCGYLFELTADEVTDSTFPTKSQTITGTLHFAWPMIASTSASSASLYVAGDGNWAAITSRWNAATANGYIMYPYAEVTSTQQGGGLSDTLTVGPNIVAWTNGDSVSEFLHPASHYTFGNTLVESYYPNITGANGFSLTYNMPLQGNEAMVSLSNNAPATFYRSNGGPYLSPRGIHIEGPTAQSLMVDQPGDVATIAVGCTSPCTSTAPVVAAGNSAYFDFLRYDQYNKQWTMSANASSSIYYFSANQFLPPFANTSIKADSSGAGYVASQQARSNASANSDMSGELVFANASAATQPLQGTYSSHPECIARPEFDEGSANRFWITYSATAFTVNFSSPVSGVVTYSCIGRN